VGAGEGADVFQAIRRTSISAFDLGLHEVSFDKSDISVANRLKHIGTFTGSHCGRRE